MPSDDDDELQRGAGGHNYGVLPLGASRSGSVPTDIKFTGQRLDDSVLYYYNARYYDPQIGRFISADTVVPGAFSSQSFLTGIHMC
jgi:RHS repeat-associated protein